MTKITNITEADMRRIAAGDTLHLRAGRYWKPDRVKHGQDYVRIESHDYVYRRRGNYWHVTAPLPQSPIGIIAITKAEPEKPKLSGEIWCVIADSSYGLMKSLHHTKENAISDSLSTKKEGYEVFAIFNPFETGGKWETGMGLELLEGVSNESV